MAGQSELPFPARPATGDQPLVPARMINEQVYCPRLAFLMWVERAWGDTGSRVTMCLDVFSERASGSSEPCASVARANRFLLQTGAAREKDVDVRRGYPVFRWSS